MWVLLLPEFTHDQFTHDQFTHDHFTHDQFTHDLFTHDQLTHNEFTHDQFTLGILPASHEWPEETSSSPSSGNESKKCC